MFRSSNTKCSTFKRTLGGAMMIFIIAAPCADASFFDFFFTTASVLPSGGSSGKRSNRGSPSSRRPPAPRAPARQTWRRTQESSEVASQEEFRGRIYDHCRRSPKKAQATMIGLGIFSVCALLMSPTLFAFVQLPGCVMFPAIFGATVAGGFAGFFCLRYRQKLNILAEFEKHPELSKKELTKKVKDTTLGLGICLGCMCLLSIFTLSFVGAFTFPHLFIASCVFAAGWIARPIHVFLKHPVSPFQSGRPTKPLQTSPAEKPLLPTMRNVDTHGIVRDHGAWNHTEHNDDQFLDIPDDSAIQRFRERKTTYSPKGGLVFEARRRLKSPTMERLAQLTKSSASL